MTCKKKKNNCSGEYNKIITIYDRRNLPPKYDKQQYRKNLDNETTVLGKIVTRDGRELFDGSNTLVGTITHIIEIPPVGFLIDKNNHRILYSGREFKVLKYENKNEDGLYIQLKCEDLGDISLSD